MAERLLLEYAVPNTVLPPGDWQPYVGWRWHEAERKWEAWWVSSNEEPFFDGHTRPWTWVADLGGTFVLDSKDDLRIEKIRHDGVTVIRFWLRG